MTIQGNFDPFHSRVSAGLPRPPPISRQTHITREEAEQMYRKIQEYENRKKMLNALGRSIVSHGLVSALKKKS
jgi:hypothetical protein